MLKVTLRLKSPGDLELVARSRYLWIMDKWLMGRWSEVGIWEVRSKRKQE